MSDRAQIETTLRDAYAARKNGDLDTLSRLFTPFCDTALAARLMQA